MKTPSIARQLLAAVKSANLGAVVSGITIGNKENRSTWQIKFTPNATAKQKADAQHLVAAFDVNAPDPRDADRATLAAFLAKTPADDGERALQAAFRLLGV